MGRREYFDGHRAFIVRYEEKVVRCVPFDPDNPLDREEAYDVAMKFAQDLLFEYEHSMPEEILSERDLVSLGIEIVEVKKKSRHGK